MEAVAAIDWQGEAGAASESVAAIDLSLLRTIEGESKSESSSSSNLSVSLESCSVLDMFLEIHK